MIYSSAADASTFYKGIPNSKPLSSFGYDANQYAGYYAVPCSGSTSLSLTFGNRAFPISYSSFTSQGYVGSSGGKQYCLGALIGNGSVGNQVNISISRSILVIFGSFFRLSLIKTVARRVS